MLRALDETVITGVATTIPADVAILSHPDFIDGRHSTRWVEDTPRPRRARRRRRRRDACGRDGADDGGPRVLREVTAEVDGRRYEVRLWVPDVVDGGGGARSGTRPHKPRAAVAGTGSGSVTAPMQGTIVKVLVAAGRHRRGGRDGVPARGHEDGERHHRREGGHGERGQGGRGRLGRARRRHRRDRVTRP